MTNDDRRRMLLQISFVLAVVATLGSLYFGEVLKYPPCQLCWYQRIAMYAVLRSGRGTCVFTATFCR